MIASAVVLTLITLSVFSPPPFTGAADPLSTTFTPKPEWNFLFLYQALKYFTGSLEPVGVAGVPAVLVLILVALPFLDHNPQRDPLKRPLALTGAALISAVLIALTIAGYVSTPGSSETSVTAGTPPAGLISLGNVPSSVEGIKKGDAVFQSSGCGGCHKVNGTGGITGPDLSNEGNQGRSHEWLTIQIRNPKAHFPDTIMPSFTKLNDQDINNLIGYLLGLKTANAQPPARAVTDTIQPVSSVNSSISAPSETYSSAPKNETGPAANIIGSADQGELLFERQCAACHGARGTGKIPNPGSDNGSVPALNPIDRKLFNKNPQEYADTIDKFIQHGSTPSGQKPRLQMPAFGDNNALTQQQISNIEAYVLRLNGVDRAELINPGMSPVRFFFITVSAFLVIMLLIGGIYLCLPRSDRDGTR
jgi:mono/diheme cytochrome c family protein